jgi:hypothetical protein
MGAMSDLDITRQDAVAGLERLLAVLGKVRTVDVGGQITGLTLEDRAAVQQWGEAVRRGLTELAAAVGRPAPEPGRYERLRDDALEMIACGNNWTAEEMRKVAIRALDGRSAAEPEKGAAA